jgi:hypothetical protein
MILTSTRALGLFRNLPLNPADIRRTSALAVFLCRWTPLFGVGQANQFFVNSAFYPTLCPRRSHVLFKDTLQLQCVHLEFNCAYLAPEFIIPPVNGSPFQTRTVHVAVSFNRRFWNVARRTSKTRKWALIDRAGH